MTIGNQFKLKAKVVKVNGIPVFVICKFCYIIGLRDCSLGRYLKRAECESCAATGYTALPFIEITGEIQ